MKPLKKKRSKVSSRGKWSRISSAPDDLNNEEINVTINEGGSRTRQVNRIAAIAEIRTRIGDRMRNHPNTIPLRHHRPTRTSQSQWTLTVPGPLREGDA